MKDRLAALGALLDTKGHRRMQLSIAGLIVCLAVFVAGYLARGPLVVSLVASVAFGSTALVMLPSLGGSSPLIYTFFAILLVAAATARRRFWQEAGAVFGQIKPLWVLCCLMLYAIVGSWLLPRFFAGQTTVFVQSRTRQGVVESVLEPVSGNISQTGYFVLGGLVAIALCILLAQSDRIGQVRRGFLLWCWLHAGMGTLDIAGKLVGAGDLLQPIRSASYAMLTNVDQSGFFRIAGAYSEASAFGGTSLACLAFSFTYWRKSGWAPAKWLSLWLLTLLLLSTSSTAYVGLAVLAVPVAISLAAAASGDRLRIGDLQMVGAIAVLVLLILAVILFDHRLLDPFVRLLDTMVFDKVDSSSGQERAYWNLKSLQAFSDTAGLGVGLGSSRASSWPVAVLSQLGLLGSLLMAALVFVVARGLRGAGVRADPETDAVVSGVRACALAGLVAGSLISGTADPGLVFFVAFAVMTTARIRLRRELAVIDPDTAYVAVRTEPGPG